jgi:hypothetical protein
MKDLFKSDEKVAGTQECFACGNTGCELIDAQGYRVYNNAAYLPAPLKFCQLCMEEYESGRNPLFQPTKPEEAA